MRRAKMKRFGLAAAAALGWASAALAASPKVMTIPAAVASTSRTPDNVKLDGSRKPAGVLAFFGLRRGMQVLDVFGANQYWAEIMVPVVGPTGHVTVWQPTQFLKDDRRNGFNAFAAAQGNVSLIASPFEAPDLP